MEQLQTISGQNNELTVILPQGKIDCLTSGNGKIGKNVKISDNSIVGWGSIVTRKFDEPNVIIAGIPAKVVKRGVNWDRKCINKYFNC